jgi:glycosyltransferase involved in cell wall biosynthesis
MRVLLVSALWPPEAIGGAEMYAAQLADRLEAAGHEVGVVTTADVDDGRVVSRIPPWPYSLKDWSAAAPWQKAAFHARDQLDPVSFTVLDRAIERFGPDVVHSHAIAGLSASALLAPRRRGVGHVHTLHDYWLLCQRSTLMTRDGGDCATRCRSCRAVSAGRLALLRHRPADVVLAVSESVAEVHRRVGVRHVRVLRNALPDLPVRAPRQPGRVRFGYLGQLIEPKGVRTLLAAAERLPADVEVLVAGTGPLEAEVEASSRVRALGWVGGEAKDAFLDSIDCLVVPSTWRDPAPLVVGEAHVRGLAVIGADIGGIPELVPPSCRPLLFVPGSAEALARSMAAFASDPDAYPVVPPVGAGWDHHLAELTAVYDEVRR